MTKAKQSLKNLYDKIALHHILGVLAFLYFFMVIYGFPKWAMYKAKRHQDIYPAYACNMVKGKNGYSIEIEGKTHYSTHLSFMWFSEEKNSIPFMKDRSRFNKDKDKYMNKNNCFKIKYIQLLEWPLISYKKIYLYEYIP